MRKWTYLVAALLMGGVSTSLTSCIDNDEPAGINDLRGAKAEFIRAKADYEAALTAIKLVEVDIKKQELAREEIQTQIKQLELEVAQAQTEYDVARINAQKDLLVEQYKTQLIQQQAWTAEAEANLIKALNALEIVKLNDRNDKFAAQIENIRVALVDANNGALAKLRKAQEEAFNAEKDLLAYDSQSKYFKSEKQLHISIKQHDLEVYEGLKADYEELNKTAGDMEALAAKKGEIQAKITALSKKEADEFQKLQEMRRSESFVAFSEAIQEYKLTQDKDTTFTLKKVDAALQNDLYNALTGVSFHTGGADLDDFFKQNPTTGEYEMTADYQSPETVSGTKVQVENVGTSVVKPITDEVKTTYQNGYTSEYNALFNARKASTDIFDAVTGKVNASIAAQVQAETGVRQPHPHRKGGTAGIPSHPGFGKDPLLPQQAGVYVLQQALAHRRGGEAGREVRPNERGGIPHPGSVRQGAGHRQMLVAGRHLQPDSQRGTRLCLCAQFTVLRPALAGRLAA